MNKSIEVFFDIFFNKAHLKYTKNLLDEESVDSIEGWAPASFNSTRNVKKRKDAPKEINLPEEIEDEDFYLNIQPISQKKKKSLNANVATSRITKAVSINDKQDIRFIPKSIRLNEHKSTEIKDSHVVSGRESHSPSTEEAEFQSKEGLNPAESTDLITECAVMSKEDKRQTNFVDHGNRDSEDELLTEATKISQAAAEKALEAFIPFAQEPEKQQQYISYLKTCAGTETSQNLYKILPKKFESCISLLLEFKKLAAVISPTLSSNFSARFKSARESSENPTDATDTSGLLLLHEYKEVFPTKSASIKEKNSPKVFEGEVSSLANIKFSKTKWDPSEAVCRIFKVPHPSSQKYHEFKLKPSGS